MKTLSDTLSPASWLTIFLGLLPVPVIIFKPSVWEYLVLLVVDNLAFFAISSLDSIVFCRLFPGGPPGLFRRELGLSTAKDTLTRVKYFDYLRKFPLRRAYYCSLLYLVKALPAALVMLFVWEREFQFSDQLARILFICLMVNTFSFFAIFIEGHLFISEKIAEVHQSEDWSAAFRLVDPQQDLHSFRTYENRSWLAIGALALTFQIVILLGATHESKLELAAQLGCVAFGGLLLIWRVLTLSRNFLENGINRIFQHFQSFDPSKAGAYLALHSSSSLARFERTFNDLVDRIRFYDQELTQWVFHQTEQSRYKALGEIAALVVHDLSAPLHVIGFCGDQIRENPEKAKDVRYQEQLGESSRRAIELVDSLRGYLKSPKSVEAEVRFGEAHDNVLRLLETQFFERDFSRVKIEVDPALADLRVGVRKADLVHILYNILSNSVENLTGNGVEAPTVRVRLLEQHESHVRIQLEDNGTGLDGERFETLTSSYPSERVSSAAREGLGLRLVRRLVERLGGTLALAADLPQQGTALVLSLGLATQKEAQV